MNDRIQSEDPFIGTVLDGRFRLERFLGAGGMGRVYVAEQTSMQRRVAVKVLQSDLVTADQAAERFFREAKLVSSLTHPNIVRVIDFGRDAELGLLFLAMELVEGVPVSRLLAGGPLRADFAVETAFQVCGALVEAHAEGIVHRDLKPDNFLVVGVADETLQVKVLDFGIAFSRGDSMKLTQSGAVCGTVPYMAPEQAQSKEVDSQADLYALGVVLYEMLSGKLPFVGTTPLSVMVQHVEDSPPPLRERISEVGPFEEELCQLVDDLLAKAPQERPNGALEVRERITAIRNEHGVRAPRVTRVDGTGSFDQFVLPDPATPHPSPETLPQPETVSPFEPTALGYTSVQDADDVGAPKAIDQDASDQDASDHDASDQDVSASDHDARDQDASDRGRVSKRGLRFVVAASLLAALGLAGAFGWSFFENHAAEGTTAAQSSERVRLAVLYVESPEDTTPKAEELIDELTFHLSKQPQIQWVDRTGVLDLLAEEGIDDPRAIGRVQSKACRIARRGNLDFSLVGELEARDDDTWRLRSKIVCTESRSVVAAFEVEGASTEEISAALVPQVVEWAETL